jgi:DNA-binding GntR family transcriptional regulator
MNDPDALIVTADHPLSAVTVAFNSISGGSLSDRAYLAMRHLILQGDLPPKTKLAEVELVNVIPVSRTPIREALRRLRDEGLITMGSSRVLEVKDADFEEALHTYQILEVLEPLAAQLATTHISDELIAELWKSIELTEFFFEKYRWDDVTRESQRFHEMLYDASGNERLARLIRRLREETHRFRRFRTRDPELVRRSLQEDREIVEALAQRNPEAVYQVMYAHIHVSTRRLQDLIAKGRSLDDDIVVH